MLCLVAQSCLTVCDPMDCSPPGSSVYRDCPVKNTGVGCHNLLQGIFPTQGSNPGLPHWQADFYHWATREAHKWPFYGFFPSGYPWMKNSQSIYACGSMVDQKSRRVLEGQFKPILGKCIPELTTVRWLSVILCTWGFLKTHFSYPWGKRGAIQIRLYLWDPPKCQKWGHCDQKHEKSKIQGRCQTREVWHDLLGGRRRIIKKKGKK